jgi:hypothetical protein
VIRQDRRSTTRLFLILTFDENEVLDRAAEVASNVVARQSKLFRLADAQRPYLVDVARRACEASPSVSRGSH